MPGYLCVRASPNFRNPGPVEGRVLAKQAFVNRVSGTLNTTQASSALASMPNGGLDGELVDDEWPIMETRGIEVRPGLATPAGVDLRVQPHRRNTSGS